MDEAHAAAKARKRHLGNWRAHEVPWADLLAPAAKRRKISMEAEIKEKDPMCKATWIADLGQNEGFSALAGTLQTLTTHGLVWSFNKARPMTCWEKLLAQGISVLDSTKVPLSPALEAFGQLSMAQQVKVAGNGQLLSV